MEFATEIGTNISALHSTIEATFEVEGDDDSQILPQTGLCALELDLRISLEEDELDRGILAEIAERGSVSPTRTDISSGLSDETFTVYTRPETVTSLRFLLEEVDSWEGPIEFKLPSYQSCKAAHQLMFGNSTIELLDDLCQIYGCETHSDATFRMLSELENWITIDINYQILNICSKMSDDVRQAISTTGTERFLSIQVAEAGEFNILSRRRLKQIVNIVNSLSELSNITLYNVIGRALSNIESERDADLLWEFEQRYEIGRHNWESILREDQLAALLGRATVEGKYNHARDIVESWIGPGEETRNIDEQFEQAREARGNEAYDLWRTGLRYAVKESNRTFEYAVAGFLHQFDTTDRNVDEKVYTKLEIFHSINSLFDVLGVDDLEIYSRARYHSIAGQLYRRANEYKRAEKEYEKALEAGLEAKDKSVRGIRVFWPLFWLYRTRARIRRENGDYDAANEVLEKGQELITSIEGADGESLADEQVQKLKAIQHETQGDKELTSHNLNAAYKHYGEAIGEYTQIGMEHERNYLKQRRNLIQASLSEQKGDFETAMEAHQNITRITDDFGFKRFNRARANISQAKSHLVELDTEAAKSALPTHLQASNVAHAEAVHLGFLLDIISNYETNDIQNPRAVLDKLQSLPDLNAVNEEFPFEYGHDYRPAVVSALAAQRLNRFNIDNMIVDELLEISVKEVLSPESAQEHIDETGISSIDLKQQWKQYFPIHIVRKFQEVREKEISGVENYADEGLALLKLVEQSIEVAGDYYAQQEFGPDWMYRFSMQDSNRLALKSLRDLLNTDPMEDLVWRDTVCELIDEPLIDEESLVEARNALGHDRISRISVEEYEEIRDRVQIILTRMRTALPIMFTVSSKSRIGLYEFDLHWENPRKYLRVQTDAALETGSRHYIPLNVVRPDPVLEIDSVDILPIQSSRAIDNLEEYME